MRSNWGFYRHLSCAILTLIFVVAPGAHQNTFAFQDTEKVEEILDFAANYLATRSRTKEITRALTKKNNSVEISQMAFFQDGDTPPNLDDIFSPDPINRPIPYDGSSGFPGLPSYSSRMGAAYIVAIEVLFQTLDFFGVEALIPLDKNQREFKVIHSKSGYFTNLSRIDVASALTSFARYLNAYLCNDMNMQNFYKAIIVQVPIEEIGFRFKYDMAWALLGNNLPKNSHEVQELGKRWQILQGLIQKGQSVSNEGAEQKKEMTSWLGMMTDVVGILDGLNKLSCFVDIRPRPKEELRKRLVVTKLLELVRTSTDRYNTQLQKLLEQARQEAESSDLENINADYDEG